MEKYNENIAMDKISTSTKAEIITTHVEPAYKKDVQSLIHGKRCWRITGQTFETLSKIFVAVGSIVSFASGVYNEPTLSFISGAISTVSLAALQFASFSYRENKKQSQELNSLLKNINIATIPTLERTADDATMSPYQQRQASTASPADNNYIPYTQYKEEIQYYNNVILSQENELKMLAKELEELKQKNNSSSKDGVEPSEEYHNTCNIS